MASKCLGMHEFIKSKAKKMTEIIKDRKSIGNYKFAVRRNENSNLKERKVRNAKKQILF